MPFVMQIRHGLALACGLLWVAAGWSSSLSAQRGGMFRGSADDPAIGYSQAALDNAVVEANRQLAEGSRRLVYEGRGGYLASALEALGIPGDSQLLVFSKTSLQARQIDEATPRALFFNDRVALGWVPDAPLIEVAAQDASQGIAFYTLEQQQDAAGGPPMFKRAFICLGCHMAGDTFGVPGLLMFSTARPALPRTSSFPNPVDQRTPLRDRFGGWFVTGRTGSNPHMGNTAAALEGRPRRDLESVQGLFDAEGYPTLSSDVAAHLVLSHQAAMFNLLTRAGWEARVAAAGEEALVAAMMSGIAREVVDYLLFIDEAPLADAVHGSSGFTERFSRQGPKDRQGRSLHELDLTRRLMKYPCSYLIYSKTFDTLPPAAKNPIYQRLWEVLSGQERGERYVKALPRADRQAIVEILRDTKSDLPAFFQGVVQ
jgi:hypothetical protein